jgi:single-strand DNA-binding protein
MNLQIIHGRLTRDPEIKFVGKDDIARCNFSVAVDRTYGEETDFFSCVAWRKTAEIVNKFFSKGKEIVVVGSMQMDRVEKDGEKRTYWNLNVERVEFCGKKSDNDGGGTSAKSTKPAADDIPEDDDDLPF